MLLTVSERRVIDDPRISLERPFIGDFNLRIRSVTFGDDGTYTCQYKLSNNVINNFVNLKIVDEGNNIINGIIVPFMYLKNAKAKRKVIL